MGTYKEVFDAMRGVSSTKAGDAEQTQPKRVKQETREALDPRRGALTDHPGRA